MLPQQPGRGPHCGLGVRCIDASNKVCALRLICVGHERSFMRFVAWTVHCGDRTATAWTQAKFNLLLAHACFIDYDAPGLLPVRDHSRRRAATRRLNGRAWSWESLRWRARRAFGSQMFEDVIDAVFGVTEQHGRVVAEEQGIMHAGVAGRSEEHTSELQSLMRNS